MKSTQKSSLRTVNRPLMGRLELSFFAIIGAVAIGTTIYGQVQVRHASQVDDYDRLDGTGKSGKKVDVVEWDKNLEIHVYPKGSVVSLGLKLDKKNSDKPVMVIGYTFNTNPNKELVRRAILGIPLYKNFKVFQDTSTKDYDKFIISNHNQQGSVVAFKYRAPKHDYPEGHPMRKDDEQNRAVAGQGKGQTPPKAVDLQGNTGNYQLPMSQPPKGVDQNGSLRHFSF